MFLCAKGIDFDSFYDTCITICFGSAVFFISHFVTAVDLIIKREWLGLH